jgi:HSP20 family protein
MSKLIRYGDYDPFAEMSRMVDQMRNLMDRSLPSFWGGETNSLALDVSEDDKNIIVQTPIPGVNEDDIDVNIQGDMLTISAETKDERQQEDRGWHMREMRYGKFSRTVRLPAEVDRSKVEAGLHNGVLTITLPKVQPSPVQRIKVKAEKLLKGNNK